jgi:hypothetical protein
VIRLKGLVFAAVGVALLATPALAAAPKVPPVHVSPGKPGPGQKITVSFKVQRPAPNGWYWWFSVLSLNRSQKHCATFAFKILNTRGTPGHTLRATLAPQMDVLRHRPSKWCTGRMAAEAQIDSRSDRTFKHSKLVALSEFKVSSTSPFR